MAHEIDSDVVRRTGLILHDDEARRTARQRTFVILGVARGGTTSVAYALVKMGLCLGPNATRYRNLEDRDFYVTNASEALAVAVDRDGKFDVWGFKRPNPHAFLPGIMSYLRNPRLVFVTRDLASNALGMAQRGELEPVRSLEKVIADTQRNMAFVEKHRCPTFFLSYEKMLVRPEDAVADLAFFCDMTVTEAIRADILSVIRPGAYLHPRTGKREEG